MKRVMNPEELLSIADRVIGDARAGEDMEVVASWSLDTEVRAYNGDVEHLVSAESTGVGVRILTDARQGTAWAGATDEDALRACVAEARDNARFASPDPNAGLAEPDGYAVTRMNLFAERLVHESTDAKIALAIELEARVRSGSAPIVGVESADYADSISAAAIVSTKGIRVASSETSAYLGAYVLAGDQSGTTSGFGFSVGRAADDLSIEVAARDAVDRAVSQLGAKKVASGKVHVIFDPYVTSQFVSLVAEMLAGDAVVRGRSPFADRLGEVMAAELVTLCDDPLDVLAPTASEVDGEGLACRKVSLVEGGVLRGFLHNAYSARCAGVRSTGSAQRSSLASPPSVGAFAASLAPGDQSSDDILTSVQDGLLVRELSGLHSGVNTISGDLSVGVEGLMVRGGSIAEPVSEVTIASTIQRMLLDITHVGSDLTYFPWEATGVTLGIADMSLSGA